MPPAGRHWAFFLDIDGTLLDIAATPEAVHTAAADCRLIRSLHVAADGALALISGRSLASIDELFAPFKFPAAGQHGCERRDAKGRRYRRAFPVQPLRRAAARIREFADSHPGLVFEDKGCSVALHYRLAPEFADAAHAVVEEAANEVGESVEVLGGKMVAELKPAGRDKGSAIEEFMREAPFQGRTPVFIGDDITDEHGFRIVNRLRGHTVKVGAGDTDAQSRLADPQAVRAWLEQCLQC
jgi:trehalose 6-phosphate phosphatase